MSNDYKIRQYRNALDQIRRIVNDLDSSNSMLIQATNNLNDNYKVNDTSLSSQKIKTVQSNVNSTSRFLSNTIIPTIKREIENLAKEE